MNELQRKILTIESLNDGIKSSIERARELRERMILTNDDPEESTEEIGFSLEILIEILRKDSEELTTAMKELQKEL